MHISCRNLRNHIATGSMHSKGKGVSSGPKQLLRTAPESSSDVYDFDQQDASHSSSANVQSGGLKSKFRSPVHVRRGARLSKKCGKKNVMCLANAVIEASQSGKTSTPCAFTGHQKTKKKLPGTPVPWARSHMQQNSFAAYTVSPIAVEHASPNDLSRQINVNSMFDDASSVIDDSALCTQKSELDELGSDCDNKMSAATSDKDSHSTCHMPKDSCSGDAERHKSQVDSGYPRFDSQCAFISLLADDNSGTVKEGRRSNCNEVQEVNLPGVQKASGSAGERNVISTDKPAQSKDKKLVRSTHGQMAADSDCEVVLCDIGNLDPKKFNSAAARNLRKVTTKCQHQVFNDVEPSDTSDESDVAIRGVKSANSVRGKQAVEHAMSQCQKTSDVLQRRFTGKDSNTASALRVHQNKKVQRKADIKNEVSEMSSDKSLHVKKVSSANKESADVLKKPELHRRRPKKAYTGSDVGKQEDIGTGREVWAPDSEWGDAECKCAISLHLTCCMRKLPSFCCISTCFRCNAHCNVKLSCLYCHYC